MKPKEYLLLDRCVEEGVMLGYARAHKHNDCPDEECIKDAIREAVMHAVSDWFDFEDATEEQA